MPQSHMTHQLVGAPEDDLEGRRLQVLVHSPLARAPLLGAGGCRCLCLVLASGAPALALLRRLLGLLLCPILVQQGGMQGRGC